MRFSGNGCQTCRNSRKKCDGRRPACERCVRLGRNCYGYREPFSIVHAEDVYASGQQKRPKGPRAKVELAARISPSLSRDVQSEAVARYVRYHLPPANARSTSEGSIREAVLSTSMSNTALGLALSSISTAIFSKVKDQPLAATQASMSYQKSLCILRATLPDIRQTNVDAYLLTIWFLSRYEDSIYSPASDAQLARLPTLSSHLHHVGATACLRYWLSCSDGTQAPSCVVTYARRSLRKVALLGQFDLPEWLQDGALFGEHGLELELDRILIRLIIARMRMSCLRKNETSLLKSPPILHILETLHREALAIDEALLAWMSVFLDSSSYTKHKLARHRTWSENDFFHPCVYSYQDQIQAAISVQCYGYRMLANHLLFQIRELIGAHPDHTLASELSEYQHAVSYLAYDMASSVPFCLGRFTTSKSLGSFGDNITVANNPEPEPYIAELIAAPLLVACTMRHMDIGHKRWFGVQLANIGRLTGYGLIEHVVTAPWFEL